VQVVNRPTDRRASNAPPVDSAEPERHLRCLGQRGLDHLRLVQTDPPPFDTRQGGRHRHKPAKRAIVTKVQVIRNVNSIQIPGGF
jgi:hypothetical protein